MPNVPVSVYVTLGAGVHVQMFPSGGQSDAKPPVLSSQESLLFIHRPTERLSRHCSTLGFEHRACGVEARYTTTQPPGFKPNY
ncbi:hypothetical protein TNCV_3055381 [Trichonephila clavipes]|nr:hypothetical protein TNCV_3055381 [Trichonephila clavipes]